MAGQEPAGGSSLGGVQAAEAHHLFASSKALAVAELGAQRHHTNNPPILYWLSTRAPTAMPAAEALQIGLADLNGAPWIFSAGCSEGTTS